jgi:hypothetical protein
LQSLDLLKECRSYRRSLQPSKENIQHLSKWNLLTFSIFCKSFLPSWIRIQSYPDPQHWCRRYTPSTIKIENYRVRTPELDKGDRKKESRGLTFCRLLPTLRCAGACCGLRFLFVPARESILA